MEFIKKSAIKVFETLGAGFNEKVYHNALEVLLNKEGIPFKSEHIIPVIFEGVEVGSVRADLVVNEDLVVELKSVKSITGNHMTQCEMYMKLTNIPRGIVINFPCANHEKVEICEIGKVVTTNYVRVNHPADVVIRL
jgi:GxxExxY protein